ncbi:transcriptional regulator [Muribacter muris]|uniref:Transcriptional regulator n=1 Tax=Muribacter muris TaxID=67855 RepID=A0A4Y9JU32_9PAST|nr:transcriptional regulator [Muribacter muris]MBF0785981.1 transcriptional regulator [Muribacter muris]MBF0826807.1 transcriptional regulator [Muribacter muris]TFV08220.1 transcriptional regulator [Muribacter muris]
MHKQSEKAKFSERLNFALNLTYPKGLKTSQIAIKFNLLHPNTPVTQQAVHKWLNGLAIPAEDKIQTLAKWLNVQPEWLKYGEVNDAPFEGKRDEQLAKLISGLSEQQKAVLIDLIMMFK